eukprot:GGOE01000384.1.p1 GENE.GGOE01000384.1~~GGOE01000384.1.p1  ORF type:complete len:542 (-),score=160.26 GGOE01000384.1:342-1967(-)
MDSMTPEMCISGIPVSATHLNVVGVTNASRVEVPSSKWKSRKVPCPSHLQGTATQDRGQSAAARRHNIRTRTTVSLEEVLLQKMSLEKQKFNLQPPPTPVSPTGSPVKIRGKGPPPHARVQEAKDRMRVLTGEKILEKPASKFATGVDLPSLGLVLRSDTLEQDFSFAVQPERERAFLATELEKEKRLLRMSREAPASEQRVQAFEELPTPVLADEPFLKFLADKVQAEVKEAEVWRQQQEREMEKGACAASSPEAGTPVREIHDRRFFPSPATDTTECRACLPGGEGLFHTSLMPDPSPIHCGSTPWDGSSPKMQHCCRNLTRALSAAARRPPSLAPPAHPQRPHTAGAALTRLFKDGKSKEEVMRGLLSRREQQGMELARLEMQEEELGALQKRLERLQSDEENEALLPQLEVQLQTLEKQRAHLHHLRRALGTPSLPSTAAVRKEQLREAQQSAWQLLLDSMAQHAQAEALAQVRSQQRQLRATRMLWQRQPRNQRPSETASPASSGVALLVPCCTAASPKTKPDDLRNLTTDVPSQV